MLALSEAYRNTLKDISLITAAVIGVCAITGIVVKFVRSSVQKIATWIDTLFTEKLQPIEKKIDKNTIILKAMVLTMEEIHKGTAELFPNGGAKLHDKIVEIHTLVGDLEKKARE